MPAYARHEIVAEGEVGVYHCVARCVRRAFLCGKDPVSGRDFEHRKSWIQNRLEELAGIFAVDVCGFAIMSNHLHVVVRTRPDLAAEWSAEELARRWWRLFPKRRGPDKTAAEPEDHELAALMADTEKLEQWRQRLASLSWLMRCLCEPIARQANREDQCTGRFWEGRFKSQALLDESSVLACALYVDLNPVRAGIATTPETSQHTSAYERIAARKHRTRPDRRRRSKPVQPADTWLCPLHAEESPATRRPGEQSASVANHSRPSFLSLDLDDYLSLLDWAGREVRRDKRGAIPADIAPILQRLQIQADGWLACIKNFGRWFHHAVGSPQSLTDLAARTGRQWLQGISHCRDVFATT